MNTQLPPGWITQVDPASGRTFYVYTSTGQTQWEFPTGNNLPVVSTAQAPMNPAAPGHTQLPPGWITQVDNASGRTFYVYTPTGQTQWDLPTGNNLPVASTVPAPMNVQAPMNPPAPGPLANDPLSKAMGLNKVPGGWVPTPNVECSIPGLEKLVVVEGLFVKQDIEAMEALTGGCCEFNNKYKVFNEQGNLVYNALEKSGFCCRCCCGPHHTLTVAFTDENGKQVALLDRPYKCTGCCPACFSFCRSRATVAMGDDQKIRSFMYQPVGGGGFKPTYNFYTGEDINIEMDNDAIARLEQTAVVEGPQCCFGGCFESDFVVRSPWEDQVYGNITKVTKWDVKSAARELLTDADNFKIDFDNAADPQMRATMMANMVLLDLMFFENEGLYKCGTNDDGKGCWCSIRPCDCYCYGLLCPCVFKCNSKYLDICLDDRQSRRRRYSSSSSSDNRRYHR